MLRYGMKNLNNLMDHILCQIFKIILNMIILNISQKNIGNRLIILQ